MPKPTTSKYIEVRNSPIHGKGIYAAKDIPKDARIIEYVGEKITKAEAQKRLTDIDEKAEEEGKVATYYIFELNKRYDIDGDVSWNTARLINHSCNPNCESEDDKYQIFIKALRDIKKGEELNYDYCFDFSDEYEDHPCLCGSKNCTGYIVKTAHRGILKATINRRKAKREREAKEN